jgi:hypothetical protein
MIFFLISSLFINLSYSTGTEDLLSNENLGQFVKGHLHSKNIKTDQVEVSRPYTPAGVITNSLLFITELTDYFSSTDPINPKSVTRIAKFSSNETDYACLVEARTIAEKHGGGVDIGLLGCSPAKLPNGMQLPGIFSPNNNYSNRTEHRRFSNENQTKPEEVVRADTPTDEKSILRAN